jgi:hypothetical protein
MNWCDPAHCCSLNLIFVTKLIESFREIMVVRDLMAFLMGCKQLGGLLMQNFQELVQSRVEDFCKSALEVVTSAT